ncbi:hypothetical protein, partial [Vibrio nigripulchritudo]|uniref:hypothetical protein n=1 Tax=Vibrio nigripulchritudo TaxID=28173 RepID=UPI001F388996
SAFQADDAGSIPAARSRFYSKAHTSVWALLFVSENYLSPFSLSAIFSSLTYLESSYFSKRLIFTQLEMNY